MVKPPSTPAVTVDGTYVTTTSPVLQAWWSSGDPTGISDYQYAVGTSPTDPGSGYTVGWTDAQTSTSAIVSGLSLVSGSTYYFYVKAENGVGMWSAVGVSDGVLAVTPVSKISDVKAMPAGQRFPAVGRECDGDLYR